MQQRAKPTLKNYPTTGILLTSPFRWRIRSCSGVANPPPPAAKAEPPITLVEAAAAAAASEEISTSRLGTLCALSDASRGASPEELDAWILDDLQNL